MITDLLGHLINGSLVLFVYSSQKKWETFDPHSIVCSLFGACMVFFGLSPLLLGSAMAVERCIGVTKPIFHSTGLASHHMKRLLGLIWVLAALVAALPVLLWRPYKVQSSRSWCFFHMEEPKDWLDVLLPLLFSMLGLLALLLSIVCNTLTSCALLQSRLRRKHHCRGTSYHIEMICQLLAIMLVSCVCWGPLLVRMRLARKHAITNVTFKLSSCQQIYLFTHLCHIDFLTLHQIHVIILSTKANNEPASFSLLMVVRMATWNQILDPWVYILLRKAVLRKIFMLLQRCWGSESHNLFPLQPSVLRSSMETSNSCAGPPDCRFLDGLLEQDSAIKSIT